MSTADFLTTYEKYAGEITDASPDYHRIMGLATMGVMLTNKVYLPWGDTKLYPNMWVVLLGESTMDRKTTSIMIPKRLIDRYQSKLVYPNEFSYERLVMMLSKRPCGVFCFSEFKTLIGLLNREYMQGARGFLADMYDAPYKYQRELAKDSYVIDHPAINIWAATTTAWFVDNLKDSDIEAGLIPRFLLVPAERRGKDKPRPPQADKGKQKEIYSWFQEFEAISGPCFLTEEAGEVHDEWYRKMRNLISVDGTRFAAFAGRLQGYLLKISMILQINLTMSLKIQGDTMMEARNIVDWLYKKMSTIEREEIAVGKSNQDITKIRKAVKRSGGEITRRDLIRATHLSKFELDRALDTMFEQESIKKKKVKGEHTKPVIVYTLVEG